MASKVKSEIPRGLSASGGAPGAVQRRHRILTVLGLPLLSVFLAQCDVNSSQSSPELAMTLSSYLGGSRFDSIRDIATDGQGNFYLTGGTTSPDFPVTAGAYQTRLNPGTPENAKISPMDAFVTKIDREGNIVWSTFLGGPNYERAYAIEVDGAGNVFVAGRAGRGFPVTAGALQTDFNGGTEADFYGPQDGFVAKLSPDGSKLLWATYFGTSDPNVIRDLAVDRHGDVYITASYRAGSYPQAIASTFNNSSRGGGDAVVAKITGDGTRVIWATYVGGSGWESGNNSIRLDGEGNPHVLLFTDSTDIPTTPGAFQQRYAGGYDLYVAKLAPQDGRLTWATYLGGPQKEDLETHELAVDAQGNVYVAAGTRSPTFPTTPGAFQSQFGRGPRHAFVAKLSADGTRLLASTFIGGSRDDCPEGIALDGEGNVYLTGMTTSTDFPVTPDAMQRALKGPRDAFVVRLAADFRRLSYASYVGGARQEFGRAAALDGQGVFYLGGETDSKDWPVSNRSANLTTVTAMYARFSPTAKQSEGRLPVR